MLSKANFLPQTQAGSWATPSAELVPVVPAVPRLKREATRCGCLPPDQQHLLEMRNIS